MIKICLKGSPITGELMTTDHKLAGKIEEVLRALLPDQVTVNIEEVAEIEISLTPEDRERLARQSYFVQLMETGHRPSVAGRAAFAEESPEKAANYTFDEYGPSH